MFKKKYAIPVSADAYINLYSACNIGCPFCKFHQNVKEIVPIRLQLEKYYNQTVLICYSVDPYPIYYQKELVPYVLKTLHKQNCKVVFLTRRVLPLYQDLALFQAQDYVGVSISENNPFNSNLADIKKVFSLAKEKGVSTWISLEPVESFSFVEHIINYFNGLVDFIRIGKNDVYLNQNWIELKEKIDALNLDYVFVKE